MWRRKQTHCRKPAWGRAICALCACCIPLLLGTAMYSACWPTTGAIAVVRSSRADPAPPSISTFAAKPFVRPKSLSDPNPKSETLRAYAAQIGLYFGSMADSNRGGGWGNPWVQNTLASEFNMMEPGNQLKWWMTQPTEDSFDFGPGDALVDFAVAHQMKIRGHNLLWGMANPAWLGNQAASEYTKFSGPELERILVNHIRSVMGHYRAKYPGIIKWWDVTNELMGWNNKFNSDGIEWTKIGTNPDHADYVRVAFRTARAADPNAILCMNDSGNDGSIPDRTRNMISIVRAFRAEGVPIDCVGMEAHVALDSAPRYDQVLQVLKAYADMGVQVQITEFDIEAPRSEENWGKASTIASGYLKACVESPNCTAFNIWGFSQDMYRNERGDSVIMLPWNEDNRPTPEYSAMRAVLKQAVH